MVEASHVHCGNFSANTGASFGDGLHLFVQIVQQGAGMVSIVAILVSGPLLALVSFWILLCKLHKRAQD